MNTHILVPIDDYAKIEQIILDSYSWEPVLDNTIPVDLSEEGIKAKAERVAAGLADYGESQFPYAMGYEQCAKDLLNTKS